MNSSQQRLHRVTVTLPHDTATRLTKMRLEHRLSVSIIVEHALAEFLAGDQDEHIAEKLSKQGASLRRKRAA